jgi:hypothetical protein
MLRSPNELVSPQLSTKPDRQSTEGYAQGSDLSIDRCASYELDGDTRHNKVFIQVRPLWGRNTYVLHLICFAVYDEISFEGSPWKDLIGLEGGE